MAKISNLEMAAAIANDSRIEIRKSLFSQKAIYTPTGSALKAHKGEYSAESGQMIKRLLEANDTQVVALAKEWQQLKSAGIGPVLLEMVYSTDGQFAAVQTFSFYDLAYHPTRDIRYFEGDAAAAVIALLA